MHILNTLGQLSHYVLMLDLLQNSYHLSVDQTSQAETLFPPVILYTESKNNR